MTQGRPNAGIEKPRNLTGRRILWWLTVGPVLAIVALALAIGTILPDGVPWQGARTHRGLLLVPDGDPTRAIWTSMEKLRADATGPPAGWTFGERVCVNVPAETEQALRQSPRDRYGDRSIWVEAIAETRVGAWSCLQPPHRGRRREVGMTLRIRRVLAVKPLGCARDLFIASGLKCPVRPKAEPLRLDDSGGDYYPLAARRAGAEGTTGVRLLVAGAGEVLSCEVVQSSGNADLDNGTCPMLRANPGLIAKKGRTKGLATGVREVTQKVTWKLSR
ncbi:MAG TPA: TonB family protein [Allosphingosinicella sp.]